MRLVFLDTETTGFTRGIDVSKGHDVIEVACVEAVDNVITGIFFHSYVKPDVKVDKKATMIHGIDDEFLKDKPTFADIAGDLLDFIGDDVVIMHNAAFDIAFLNSKFETLVNKPRKNFRFIDSLLIARRLFPFQDNRLDALCRTFGVTNRGKHSAIGDAFALAEVYLKMAAMAPHGFF